MVLELTGIFSGDTDTKQEKSYDVSAYYKAFHVDWAELVLCEILSRKSLHFFGIRR